MTALDGTPLAGQVCVVTGASSGIGAATAELLAQRGAAVVLAARRAERLEEIVRRIEAGGGRALAVPCDVADRPQVERLVTSATDAFGRLDILVNNAGVMCLAPMVKCRTDDWDAMIDINVKGLLYGIGAALPVMLDQGTGHVINVSSVAGRRHFNGATVYCGTKHAVHAITEGLREELGEQAKTDGNRVRVTVLAPGVVATELGSSVRDPETRAVTEDYYEHFEDPLTSADMAEAIRWVVEAPDHVNVNEILVRPVRQVK